MFTVRRQLRRGAALRTVHVITRMRSAVMAAALGPQLMWKVHVLALRKCQRGRGIPPKKQQEVCNL